MLWGYFGVRICSGRWYLGGEGFFFEVWRFEFWRRKDNKGRGVE